MDLTILITTFMRAHLLRWYFVALTRQKINCKYEILVLNDGLEDETKAVCDSFADKLPIRYLFTGRRNSMQNMVWRVSGMVVNIGIKQALGKNVIISCAEMFLLGDHQDGKDQNDTIVQSMVDMLNANPKAVVYTDGRDDIAGRYLEYVVNSNGWYDVSLYYSPAMRDLCTTYPFFLAVNREEVIKIGGYDEGMTGFAWDDTEFSRRLKQNGFEFIKLPTAKVVHLFHMRTRPGMPNLHEQQAFNKHIYDTTANRLVVNVGKEWGVL